MKNKIKTAAEIFDKRADDYHNKFMDVNQYSRSFDLFCENIPEKKATVLELGCGPGNITKYLLNKRPDLKILATDLSPRMIEIAKINNPGAEFELMDCRDIDKIKTKYDAVMCGFCLPYLSEKESAKLIGDAAAILKPGGVFYISTMEEDADNKSGIKISSHGDRLYIYYHKADRLSDALTKNNFEIINLQRQDYSPGDGTKTTDLLILAKKR